MRQRRNGKWASTALVFAIAVLWLFQPSMNGPLSPSPTPPAGVAALPAEKTARARHTQLGEIYGRLPLSFEQNQGQVDGTVKFLSRGDGYTLFLTATDAVLALTARSPKNDQLAVPARRRESPRATSAVLRMKVIGANPAPEVAGLDESAGKSNYFMGSDPAAWRPNVATYARVKYPEVYPGIDLIYYGNQRQLEYDWIVRPGAEPGAIAFAFEGAKSTEVDSNGDLVLATAGGEVRLNKPVIYQETDEGRREIAGEFAPRSNKEIGFTVANYDRTRPLVIDPVLSYSTYLGGYSYDEGWDIAVDSSGNAYVTGWTSSIDFPSDNPSQPYRGDAFVTKFDPAGSALLYSTYYGGADFDLATAIAVDSSGNAYLTGSTLSTDFPTVNPLQPANGGFYDAFVAKFDHSGRLVYSTYYGGAARDDGRGIAVDSAGSVYIVGISNSSNLPAVPGAGAGGALRFSNAFVAKLNPSGSVLVYRAQFGGDDGDTFGFDIAVDPAGNIYITGTSYSAELQAIGARRGPSDAFVAKFTPSGIPVYATYHGGTGSDSGVGIALDSWGNAYVTGVTDSSDFPTSDPFQPNRSGDTDAFVTKFNHSLNALVYSTYLGGREWDSVGGIDVDSWGNAYVTGGTASTDFPTANPLQPNLSGDSDAFVAVFNRWGTALAFSTYQGGSVDDWAVGVAVDSSSNVYVTGSTRSIDFPTADPLQAAIKSVKDAFVIKIDDVIVSDDVAISVSPMTVLPGGWVMATWTNIPSPTANDWIGLYGTWRAADDAYLSRTPIYGRASGRISVTVPSEAAFGATYELRLFNNNTRVGTSNTFTVQRPTLSVLSNTVSAGRTIAVSWAYVPSPTVNDWIGLFASSLGSNSAYLANQFTNGRESGSMSFAIPADTPAGTTYELRLLSNSSYTRLATSDSFTILAPTLNVSPTIARRGASVTTSWANIGRPSPTDWIGLYMSSAASNNAYLTYRYTTGAADGAVVFAIPAFVPTGASFELRLFSNNGYSRLATSNSFRVEVSTLRVSPTPAFPGLLVMATWANVPNPTVRDWIGLYASSGAADSPAISRMYTYGVANGHLPFVIPAGTVPGTTYELRLFSNNGSSRLATSNTFTVQAWPAATGSDGRD